MATGYSFVDSMLNEACEFVGDDVYGRERVGTSCREWIGLGDWKVGW